LTQEAQERKPEGKLKSRGYAYPGVEHLPNQVPSIQWTWWRWLLLAIAVLSSVYFFWIVNSASWYMVGKFFSPHEGPVVIPWPTDPKVLEQSFWHDIKLVVAGVVVLLCMLGIAGKQAVGLGTGRSAWRLHRIGLGYYLRTVFPFTLLLPFITHALLTRFPKLQEFTAYRSGTAPKNETYEIFLSFAAGFTEEVIATVFLYWLLSFIPWRRLTGIETTFGATGLGMMIIILAHLSYHTYYGISVWELTFAVMLSVVCWHFTQSLWALVIGHAGWDLFVLLPGMTTKLVVCGLLVLMGLALDPYWKVKVPADQRD
jgi:hypothetical protein